MDNVKHSNLNGKEQTIQGKKTFTKIKLVIKLVQHVFFVSTQRQKITYIYNKFIISYYYVSINKRNRLFLQDFGGDPMNLSTVEWFSVELHECVVARFLTSDCTVSAQFHPWNGEDRSTVTVRKIDYVFFIMLE